MIPEEEVLEAYKTACPHTRGDDPKEDNIADKLGYLSPHAWG